MAANRAIATTRDRLVQAGDTPLFQPGDAGNAVQTEADAPRWREAGGRWVGGTLKGLTSKIGYLQRLGVTALWVSPIFKQVPFQDTYHGYGIQNFLDVDPHFGTRRDLRDPGAHRPPPRHLRHPGYHPQPFRQCVWLSSPTATGRRTLPAAQSYLDPRWDGGPYHVDGFHDPSGQPGLPFGPVDLQPAPPRLARRRRRGRRNSKPRKPSPPEAASTTGITTRSSMEGDFL